MDENQQQKENLSDKNVDAIVSNLQYISQIEAPLKRELAILELSKKTGFSIRDYHALLKAYSKQKKSGWTQWKISKPIIWIENVFEEINYWLEEWDFLKFLDYASKITIVVGAITFILQLSKLEERTHLERRRVLYEAWRVVNSATNQSGSGGRIDALQTLVENNVSLSGINLENAYLAGIDLTGADLQGANLRGVNLVNADLSHANFADADLLGADLNEAIFHKANLRGAKLQGADNMITAYFENAFYDETTTGKIANSGAILLKSLSGLDLRGETRLKAGPLEKLDFSRANLAGVDLGNANLIQSSFEGANLQEANLESANISSARFDGANLTGANLRHTTADSFFIYDDSTQFPEDFDLAKGINLDSLIVGEGGTLTWGMALRNGERIPNSIAVIENIQTLAQHVENLQRDSQLEFKVNSWYRPEGINRIVGGSNVSAHLEGKAVDVAWTNMEEVSCEDIVKQYLDLWPGHIGCSSVFMHLDTIEPFPLNDDSKTWKHDF